MCLIVLGWQAHVEFPLLVAANRDEFYARPTAFAARWPDTPQVIGGLDLEAGGTWLGVTESGRFAAVTNVREPGASKGQRSRGELTRSFLQSDISAKHYIAQLDMSEFSGFNLFVSDGHSLYYCSNRHAQAQRLLPGIYGVSNHLLDTPWPKLVKARQAFADALPGLPDETPFFDLLADREQVDDARLPNTGVPLAWERLLSSIFVQSENYGTRASTVLQQKIDGSLRLSERSFGPNGQVLQSSVISTSV